MDKALKLAIALLLLATGVRAQLVAIATGKPPSGAASTGWIQTKTNADNTGSATTLAVTPNSGITAGNCPVIALTTNTDSTVSSVKDNNNFAYTLMDSATNAGHTTVKIYSIPGTCSAASGITSFTATFTSGVNIVMAVSEYAPSSGSLTTGQLVAATANSQTSGTISIPTQANNNFIVSAFQLSGGSSIAAGANGNLRACASGSGCATTFSGDQAAFMDNTSASPGTTTTNITWTTSANYGVAAIELSTNSFNVVQFAANNGLSTSVSFTQPTQVGNYVIAMVFDGTAAGLNETFTDSASNSYTQVSIGGNTFCSMATDGDTLAMSYAKVATGSSALGVTVNSPNAGKRVYIVELDGMATSSVLDQVSNCTDTLAVTTLTTGNVTTGTAKEIIIPFIGSSNFSTYTVGTNYTFLNQFPVGANAGIAADEFRSVAATGTYNGSMTINNSSEMTGFLATFKAQ